MVQFWSALAARDTELMTHVMGTHFPEVLNNATYATYIRCHDDIGWAITEEDAEAVGVTGPGHRAFLSDFYEGIFPGSFARGALFGVNEKTGDKRMSGSFASLAGLERALDEGDAAGVDRAVARINLGHTLIAGYGGIPLIYMGDEIAMLNDYGYRDDPDHARDSRWLHRSEMDWGVVDRVRRGDDGSPESRVWHGLKHILDRRKATPELHAGHPVRVPVAPVKGVFALLHDAPTGPLLCLFNFTEDTVFVPGEWALGEGVEALHDALTDRPAQMDNGNLVLLPYGSLWLR